MGRPTSKIPLHLLTFSLPLPLPLPDLLTREKSLSTSWGGLGQLVQSDIIISGLALITLSLDSSVHIIWHQTQTLPCPKQANLASKRHSESQPSQTARDGQKKGGRTWERRGADIIMHHILALLFLFFPSPVSFFIPLLCSLLISLNMCQFDSSLTKLWMIYVKRLREKKRGKRDLRDSFKVTTLQLTRLTCIGYHLNDCWINKRFFENLLKCVLEIHQM